MSVENEIAAVNKAFCAAFNSGDAEQIRPFYTDDPWFLAPNAEPIKGIDAVIDTLQGFIDSGISGIALSTTEIDHQGDTAIEIGEYVLSAGDAVADQGKFLVVWKNIDGNWRLHRDMISSNLPAPE